MSSKHEQPYLLCITRLAVMMTIVCCGASSALAQFSSGSTGADGPLNITDPGVTNFTQVPMGGGNIYNFTTINIAAGSTLKISGQSFPYPLLFLAQGAVTISGTIDISGAAGVLIGNNPDNRTATTAGVGGYSGGLGGFGSNPNTPGNGPGGGQVNYTGCNGWGGGGQFSGNKYLVPLVGGSGGGGGACLALGITGANGGGGGGALLIASSVSIAVNSGSVINASGGIAMYTGCGGIYSGAGSGGAIRLVSNSISGTGTLSAAGGSASNATCGGISSAGTAGVVRLEAFQNTFSGSIIGQGYAAAPYSLFLPAQPSIAVVSIGGQPVSTSPTGSFTVPDVVVNSSSPLPAQIQAQNVPVGTVVTLYVFSENGPDQALTATLQGTIGSSTATATVTLPTGYSRGYVKATWTQ